MKICTRTAFERLTMLPVIACLVIASSIAADDDTTSDADKADAKKAPQAVAEEDAGQDDAPAQETVKAKAANINILQPKFFLPVLKGKSKIIRTKEPIIRVSVGSEKIADVIPFRRNEVGVSGNALGTTTLTLWVGDKKNTKVLHMLVRVEENEASDQK